MTGLTTHVLDTAAGLPAQGLRIDLFRLSGDAREKIASVVTNHDGRVDGGPILIGDSFPAIICGPRAWRFPSRPSSMSSLCVSASPT